jgi:glycosyltransferase involved in cell wall biosynthesis
MSFDFGGLVKTLENEIIGGASEQAGPIIKRKKLFLVSTDINQPTGYAKVSHQIIQQLASKSWLDIVHFAIQRLQDGTTGRTYPTTPNLKIYNAVELEKQANTGFAIKELPQILAKEQPDVLLIYNDSAVISAYLEEIRKADLKRTFQIWAYLDQIYTYQPPAYIDILNRDCARIFVFSRKWKECLKEQGISRPVDVMGHGFDGQMFRQIPKEIARQTAGIPKDAFVILSVNRNQPRKRLDILIMAFVEFLIKFPTKPIYLMCICDKGDKGGYPLFDIYARELRLRGASTDFFGSRLMVSSRDMCFKDNEINIFYNMADVGISCAEGEGFGLCSFEGMGVGVPQIVPDIIGYREYCTEENSIIVPTTERYYLPTIYSPVGGEAKTVSPKYIAAAMEKYFLEEDLRSIHGARAKLAIATYTWEKAVSSLVKRLEQLDEDD